MRIEPFTLEDWMTRYETQVEFDLAESGIQPLSTIELVTLTGEQDEFSRILASPLLYSEARGTEELRSLIAALYRDANPDQVLVTTGAIEANYLAFNVLLNPGDEMVCVFPAYQQLYSVPRAIGCDVRLWRLRRENDFRYDLDDLRRLVTRKTRMIVINTPHNPTGSVLSQDELRQVYEIAGGVGAWVLGDEAYRWLELPGRDPLAGPVRNLGERGISVGTISKPFGLPGLRIGWLVAPESIVNAAWRHRDYVTLSPGLINDRLAQIALRHTDRLLERTRGISSANLAHLQQWIREREGLIDWVEPRGGLLGLLRYNINVPSSELADRLAADASVMLAPGSAFDQEHHLRIGLGADPEKFRDGLAIAASFLERIASE
jgi:aspartate/methionine/tyrosine aminotransferase